MILDKGYSIKIEAYRCLNRRYRGSECRHCLSYCPADAIVLNQGHIDLNGNHCIGCGLCLSDCPTQVFRSGEWNETSLIDQVKRQGWKITEFYCAKHPAPYRSAKTPERGALQLPACLTVVSRGAWYELGLQTAVELHLDQCPECQMTRTLPRLDVNIGTASEWLAASGHAPQFSYIQTGPAGTNRKHLKAVETGFKVTSRRDLFLSLIQGGRQLAGPMHEAPLQCSEENEQGKLHPLLPDWLKRLAEVYSPNMTESSVSACWPTLKINNRCVHCGLCNLLCPSGALQQVTDNGTCSCIFTAGLCLDCRICRMVCPQDAMIRDKEPVANPFEPAIIYKSPVRECRRCEGIASYFSTGLCHWCSKEKVAEQAFNEACHTLLLGDKSDDSDKKNEGNGL